MTVMPPGFRQPRRDLRRADPDLRDCLGDWALGMALGALLAVGLLLGDVLGLRTTLWRADRALAGSMLFIGGFALVAGGVASGGMAAWRAGRKDDDEPRGGRPIPALAFAAAPRRAR